MRLSKLSLVQIESIYKEYMVYDFPEDELKPLSIIMDALSKDIYECLGLFDQLELVGYMYLVKNGSDYLIDYLAIVPSFRNKGFGGIMLKLLSDYLSDASSIIAEVEDPDFAEDQEAIKLQIRRLNFYLRNGFISTGVKVRCFGVPFLIIETLNKHLESEISSLYKMQYKALLPAKMYEKNIFVLEDLK